MNKFVKTSTVLTVSILCFLGCSLMSNGNALGKADSGGAGAVSKAIKFEPTFESLKQYVVPEWYMDAKLGIFMHWGPVSIPGMSCWYARGMYMQNSEDYKYHVKTYGDPAVFGWKDICKLWNPTNFDAAQADSLTKLYKKAGARYIVPVAVHHDNFDMWNSKYQPRWNSYAICGKDTIGMWKTAAENNGMRLGVASHNARSYRWLQTSHGKSPLSGKPYDGQDPANYDLYGVPWNYDGTDYERNGDEGPADWELQYENRMIDLLDKYHPDLYYVDGGIPFHKRPAGLNILSHLYNQNQVWNGRLDAVANIKCDWQANIAVPDSECGISGGMMKYYWQTDASINNDWYWARNDSYKSANCIEDAFIDIVSKNGNLLLNVPLKADGTLEQGCIDILNEMAQCNYIIGEAIFNTRAWEVFGEGPTEFTMINSIGTSKDIRFTQSEDRKTLYAILLDWPGNGAEITISTLKAGAIDSKGISSITMLGSDGSLKWSQDSTGLKVTVPSVKPDSLDAFALKIKFKGNMPAYNFPHVDAYSQIKAESCNLLSGYAGFGKTCEGKVITGGRFGDYIVYKSVDFGTGAASFTARLGDASGSQMSIRLDSPAGKLVGVKPGVNTGGWETFSNVTCAVSGASGIHDLYLVFDSNWFNLNWFKFTAEGGVTPAPAPTANP